MLEKRSGTIPYQICGIINLIAVLDRSHIQRHGNYSTSKPCPGDPSSGDFWSNKIMKLEQMRDTDMGTSSRGQIYISETKLREPLLDTTLRKWNLGRV